MGYLPEDDDSLDVFVERALRRAAEAQERGEDTERRRQEIAIWFVTTDEHVRQILTSDAAGDLREPLVTLTEAATWLAFEFALAPAIWTRNSERLRDVSHRILARVQEVRDGPLPLLVPDVEEWKRVTTWWRDKSAEVEAQANGAALALLRKAQLGELVIQGRALGALHALPISVDSFLLPIGVDLSLNALVFDETTAVQLRSSYVRSDGLGWTDLRLVAGDVAALRLPLNSSTTDVPPVVPVDQHSLTHSGLAGRPNAKHLFMNQLEQRIVAGTAYLDETYKEAKHLRDWLRAHYPDMSCPAALKTIVNNIAPRLQRAREEIRPK